MNHKTFQSLQRSSIVLLKGDRILLANLNEINSRNLGLFALEEHFSNQDELPRIKNKPTGDTQLKESSKVLLKQDQAAENPPPLKPDSVFLEPENIEEHKEIEETTVTLEEPILQAEYLMKEIPKMQTIIDTHIDTVEDHMPTDNTEVEFETQEDATLEGDFIVVEEPTAEMDSWRNRRMTLKKGRQTCRGFTIQGICYQLFKQNLNASDAETNTFTWLDGSPWIYNSFVSGEPNNFGGIEDCVEMLCNGGFNDVACHVAQPFICSCPVLTA
ncbi:hypothetical protein DNTS_006066 [Danionella cerebrum]|uniref:C-type lectin domain-containing protein n=1 Tax=Danionella cerebrum TaxID=2873325 RepID=A0A553NLA6_9TELE|nr:hypothetical protein DNTS_006066 [Danionella translucida]